MQITFLAQMLDYELLEQACLLARRQNVQKEQPSVLVKALPHFAKLLAEIGSGLKSHAFEKRARSQILQGHPKTKAVVLGLVVIGVRALVLVGVNRLA